MGNTYLSGYDAAGNAVYATAEPATDAEMALDSATQRGLNLDALTGQSGSSGGLPTLPALPSSGIGASISNALTGVIGWVDKNVPVLGAADSAVGLNPNTPGSGILGSIASSTKAINTGLAFISDIPRVTTTLLGLILIIAGIFALSKGPAVNIVTSAVKDAVTS